MIVMRIQEQAFGGLDRDSLTDERRRFCTLVRPTFTDSHSDDPDGSNHCFVGRKLWLVWDTFLGIGRGYRLA
jgi:hypothetical protein